MQQRESSWFFFPQPRPQSRVRLFCFPYAGSGASVYRSWTKELPPTIEVFPVQIPGRENKLKEATIRQLKPLIEVLGPVLLPYTTKPFAFFGHSMGALISFELARYLRDCGSPEPIHLFISSYQAPQLPVSSQKTYHLPEDEFIQAVRDYQGTEQWVLEDENVMQILLPILRADFEICQTYDYRPGKPLNSPITVFGGLQDNTIQRAELEAWAEQTSKEFQMTLFPAGSVVLVPD